MRAFSFLVALFVSITASAAQFKDGTVLLQMEAGKASTIPLRQYLVDPNEPDLKFSVGSAPAWLKVDATLEALVGTPPSSAVGILNLTLTVRDKTGEHVDLNHPAQMTIVIAPSFTQSPLNLGTQFEDKPFQLDLNSVVSNPSGGALVYSTPSGMPGWMTLLPTGQLSGTPARADVGPYTNFMITVTSVATGLSATVPAFGTVVKTLHAPSWITSPTILTDAFEDSPYSGDLTTKVTLREPGPLTFTFKATPPAWLKLSADGQLSGTPKFADVGTVSVLAHFTQLVDGQTLDGGDSVLTFKVIHVNHPPKWSQDPISFTTTAESPFNVTIATFASDPDTTDTLTFTKLTGPAWATVTNRGVITGTPQQGDSGDNVLTVRVDDGHGGTADVTVKVKIVPANHAPYWTKNPIPLPNATEKSPYGQSVASFAKDPDAGDTLTFSKVTGPAWITVAADGTLSGTPARADAGLNTFTVRVTDQGGLKADVVVTITVDKVYGPPHWTKNPIPLPNGTEDVTYSYNVAPFAANDPGDDLPLTFSIISGPTWLTITSDGKLGGKPAHADVGNFSAVLQVDNGHGTAVTTANGQVLKQYHPPVIPAAGISFTVKERATLTDDLNNYVTNPDQATLLYSLLSTVDYVKLGTDGKITISPLFKDIGDHDYNFKVSDGITSPNGVIHVHVLRDPRPPIWKESPIRLTTGLDKPISQSLAGRAQDLDGITLAFKKISGPEWLTIAPNGTLTGTPHADALGENTFQIEVRNDMLGAPNTLIITVVDMNNPPYWTANPLNLPDGKPGKAYSQTVVPYAKDPDVGDTLTFSKVSGPAWAFLTSGGLLIGTPAAADGGVQTLVARVTDNHGAFADTTIQINIPIPINHPPKWLKDPIPLGDIPVEKLFTFNFAPLATDEDGDQLTFKMLSGPAWLTVDANGLAHGTPAKSDIGEFTAVIEVSDGRLTAQAGAFGKVFEKPGNPPVINAGALVFTVTEDQVLTDNLNQAKFVTSPDGRPLTFAITGGQPQFIQLLNNGALTLSPKHADIGDYNVPVRVTDDRGLFADGTMIVHVLKKPDVPTTDVVQIDSAVPNAPVENTWVFDNWKKNGKIIGAMLDNVHVYFEDLARANVRHDAILLSSIFDKHKSDPVPSASGNPLLLSSQGDWVKDFTARVDSKYVGGLLSCHVCQSPIWVLFQMYQKLPTLPIYHNGFQMPEVPSDVMIVSPRHDDYKHYAKGTPQETATPTQYAQGFTQYHAVEGKPYRISAIASCGCREEVGEAKDDCRDKCEREAQNEYQELTGATGGTYYHWTASADVAGFMHDYAAKVIFRAYVYAKTKIALSKIPSDPNGIEVRLGGALLPSDCWEYDKASNTIRMHWTKVNPALVKPGAKLEITYRTT